MIADPIITELRLPSRLGFEKVAMDTAASVAALMGFTDDRVQDLKTAVSEACINAIEHGNQLNESLSVVVTLAMNVDTQTRQTERSRGRARIWPVRPVSPRRPLSCSQARFPEVPRPCRAQTPGRRNAAGEAAGDAARATRGASPPTTPRSGIQGSPRPGRDGAPPWIRHSPRAGRSRKLRPRFRQERRIRHSRSTLKP